MKRSIARSISLTLALCLSAPLLYAGGGSSLKAQSHSQHKSSAYGQSHQQTSSFGKHGKSLGSHGGGFYKKGSSGHGSSGGHYGKSSSFGITFGGGHYGHAPKKVWVPGSWSLSQHKVWIPGCAQQVWCPAVFETRVGFGGQCFQVQISAGHYQTVQTPGHFEWQSQRVWNEGHWEYVN